MRSLRVLLLGLCCVVLFVGLSEAQTNRNAKKSKDDWTPAEKGCSRFVVERKLGKPGNPKELFYYLSFRLRGKNTVKGYEYNCLPVIDNLDLDKTELSVCSQVNFNDDATQTGHVSVVKVSIKAHDLDNDPLVFQYSVTSGKIEGTGSNVIWDLTGVPPGIYKITVGADDGCGVCAEPTVKEIKVVESADCRAQTLNKQ